MKERREKFSYPYEVFSRNLFQQLLPAIKSGGSRSEWYGHKWFERGSQRFKFNNTLTRNKRNVLDSPIHRDGRDGAILRQNHYLSSKRLTCPIVVVAILRIHPHKYYFPARKRICVGLVFLGGHVICTPTQNTDNNLLSHRYSPLQ